MRRRPLAVLAMLTVIALGTLAACRSGSEPSGPTTAPEDGACRNLTQADLSMPSNDSTTIDCSLPHTSETFMVGTFPATLDGPSPDRPELGAYVHDVCQPKFLDYVGADESLGLRTLLTWVWFRPARNAWDTGARWFRCDVVGGGTETKSLLTLPETVRGLLGDKPDDQWMACASGPNVDVAAKVPCSTDHNWRAVSTVVLGSYTQSYPGDEAVKRLSVSYCKDSVSAWLGYPSQFDFGYTWFPEAKWNAGNRRSVCWAKTNL